MNHDTDLSDPVAVSVDDVSVEKTFTADEFPVPAIKFVIKSTSTDAVDIRLTDEIPESFPMDCIGFHPDYENDHWTAYKDHRVEFVRTLGPEESLITVYGIRLDEAKDDPAAFLGRPELNLVSTEESGGTEAEGVADILGEDNNTVVREALSGERDGVPGMDDESDLDFEDPLAADAASDPLADDEADSLDTHDADELTETTESDETLELDDPDESDSPNDPSEVTPVEVPDPRSVDTDTRPAVTERPPDAPPLTLFGETDAGRDSEVPHVAQEADIPDETATESVAAAQSAESVVPETESVAAALAAEIRQGRVDDDDLTLLKRELDIGVPNSVDIRIQRLQSQMDDLAAYSDALAMFIDEEGTGKQLINDFRNDIESLSASLASLETALSAAESDRVDLRNEVDDVTTTVRGVETTVTDVEATVSDVEARVETNSADLSEVSSHMDELVGVADEFDALSESVELLDTEMDDVRTDMADLDSELTETRSGLTSDVEDLRSTLQEIHSDIEELKRFRNRLGSAFGGN